MIKVRSQITNGNEWEPNVNKKRRYCCCRLVDDNFKRNQIAFCTFLFWSFSFRFISYLNWGIYINFMRKNFLYNFFFFWFFDSKTHKFSFKSNKFNFNFNFILIYIFPHHPYYEFNEANNSKDTRKKNK